MKGLRKINSTQPTPIGGRTSRIFRKKSGAFFPGVRFARTKRCGREKKGLKLQNPLTSIRETVLEGERKSKRGQARSGKKGKRL